MLIKSRKVDGTPEVKENLRLTLVNAELENGDGYRQTLDKDEKPQEYTNLNIFRRHHQSGLVEEFVNTPQGLRQNFEIFAQPENQTQTLALYISAGENVQLSQKYKYIQIETENQKIYTYSGLKSWDNSGRELASEMSIKNGAICLHIQTNQAEFPIYIDPLLTSPSDTLEQNQAGALFGSSVSSAGDVNGDGYSDVMVSAPTYDNGQTNEGAVFVYHGSSSGIENSPSFNTESNLDNAQMGYSVCTAGDVNGDGYSDIIIGVSGYDNGQTDEGQARVYHGSATGLDTTVDWSFESNQASAQFGNCVATAGDVNGDGYSDVIIGALLYDNGQLDEGRAFMFKGSSTGLSTSASWTAESNQAAAYFGFALASAGDVNGDGYSDVIIGAYRYDNGHSDEGRTYVYHGTSTGLNTSSSWTAESNQATAYFGCSVASAGDVNGDGYADVIVGAYNYDNDQSNEGRAFVYHGSSTGLNTSAAWTIENNQANSNLGWFVFSAGDVNGDGYSDVLISAPYYDNGNTNEGIVYLHQGSYNGLSTAASWSFEVNQDIGLLGYSIASAGDVNGDGFSDIILGDSYFDNGQNNEGAAFVFYGNTNGLNATPNWTVESNQASALFGYSVASAGDVNGDGYSDVAVGASQYDNGQTDEGAVFVYHGSSSGLSSSANWSAEGNQASSDFWKSACAGDVNGDGFSDLIIGAYSFSNGHSAEGKVFVYHGSSGGLNSTPNWTYESNINAARFGCSVSSAGDVNGDGYSDVVIGAYGYNNGHSYEGAAYVFHGSNAGLMDTVHNLLESNQIDAYYGYSVASAGDVNGDGYSDIIVGAYGYDSGQTNEGATFVFHGSNIGISNSANWTADCDQSYSYYGYSVSSAGDVNGDGYSDILIGALQYTNGQGAEGATYVFHGSNSGLEANPSWVIEINQSTAYFGCSVSSAGDLNGDGYSDIIIGAYGYSNGQSYEGAAFVYHGSVKGIDTSIVTKIESNHASAYSGVSVATAGDVNGDGYSDVVIGANYYSNGQANEGRAFVYYGNDIDSISKRNNLRLYNTNLTSPISASNLTSSKFGVGLFAKSYLGRTKARLVWEIKKQNDSFSQASPITNSTQFTAKSTSFTSTGTAGVELKDSVNKITGAVTNKVRVRIEYDKATAITGQVYGPWKYLPTYTAGAMGMGATPLPIDLLHFQAVPGAEHTAILHWVTALSNHRPWRIQRSYDGIHFLNIGQVEETGWTQFAFKDNTLPASAMEVFYRLVQTNEQGTQDYSPIQRIQFTDSYTQRIDIYPNPSQENLYILNHGQAELEGIRIYDATGKLLQSHTGNITQLPNWSALPAGIYMIHFSFGDQHQETVRVVHW